MDLELLRHAKGYIEKLANGINPLTGERVSDSDIINNVRISRCLFFVNEVLGEVLSNKGIGNVKDRKVAFYLTKEEIQKYNFTDEDLSVSKIVGRINQLITNGNMSKLKATSVCKWLISIGLLEEIEINGRKNKRPTLDGKNMGMYVEQRFGSYGSYDIVLYNRTMQEFIIDNFESLLDFLDR